MYLRLIPTLLSLLLLALGHSGASAQVVLDTARGLVGQEVQLALRTREAIASSDSITIRGGFHLSNATVFYPERFVGATSSTVSRYELTRLTDSTYDFTVVVALGGRAPAAGDTLVLLAGEALAGFDSICVVRFSGLRTNDAPASDVAGIIITGSIGTRLPYIRYATLEPGYPNPARRYETVTWAFRIDKASNIRFGIYNLGGEQIYDHDLGELAPGIHLETFNIGFDVASGVYLVAMQTNSGNAWQYFHVVK
jgi:hypothetical protein